MEQCVIESDTVNAFKNGLRRTLKNKMGFFVDQLIRLAQASLDSGDPFSEQVRPHLVR